MRCGGWSVGLEGALYSLPSLNFAGKANPKDILRIGVDSCSASCGCVFESGQASERTVTELAPLKNACVVCQAVYEPYSLGCGAILRNRHDEKGILG
jgi:hypothetical protein